MINKDKLNNELFNKAIQNIYKNNLKDIRRIKREVSEDVSYLDYTPNERSLYNQIEKVRDESRAALAEAKNALFEAKKAQSKAESIEWILVVLIVVLSIEFSSRLVSSLFSFRDVINNIDNYVSWLRVNQKEFEMREKSLEEKIEYLSNSIDSKVELSVYKILDNKRK